MKFQKFCLCAISLLALPFFISSCKDKKGGDGFGAVELVFKVEKDNQPLVFGQPSAQGSALLGGRPMLINNYRFYLTDVKLMKNGNPTQVLEAGLIDFNNSHTTLEGAQNGESLSLENIPAGSYDAIEFGVGVMPSLNAMEPLDFDSENPLSFASNYWASWNSYIFSRIEGNADLDGDGTQEHGFSYHIGGDDRYRVVTYTRNILIDDVVIPRLSFTIDVERLFTDPNAVAGQRDMIDLITEPMSHSNPNDAQAVRIAEFFMDQYQAAMTLD